MSRWKIVGLGAAAVLGLGIGALLEPIGPAVAHEPELSRYTYWDEIRPLMERHCASCHTGGGPAPVNLMRYADAIPWANSIARQVLERRMPPWLPDDGIGAFAHARTLDEQETNMLVDWAIGLAPEGDPPEAAPPDPALDGDPLPTARLTPASPIRIGEEASEASVCAELVRGEGVGEAAGGFALVSGAGGAEAIRRRATLFVGNGCDDGVPVFTWVVGQGPRLRPEGAHDPLPAGADLFLAVDYRKGFDTEGYAFEDDLKIAVFPAGDGADVETVALEPGTSEVGPAALLAILPPLDHAAFSGPGNEVFAVQAVGADGGVTELLRIRRPDADWTERFVLAEPLWLDQGTSVRVSHPGVMLDLVRPGESEIGPDGASSLADANRSLR